MDILLFTNSHLIVFFQPKQKELAGRNVICGKCREKKKEKFNSSVFHPLICGFLISGNELFSFYILSIEKSIEILILNGKNQ